MEGFLCFNMRQEEVLVSNGESIESTAAYFGFVVFVCFTKLAESVLD